MTQLTMLAVTRRTPAWIQAGVKEYTKRLPRELKLDIVEIQAARRRANTTAESLKRDEAQSILKQLRTDDIVIALDEHGETLSTQALAGRLEDWMQRGRNASFVIGGADGLHDSVRQRSDHTWSLSALTLPHALVRVVLAEQIYRACCILRHHPYHRE